MRSTTVVFAKIPAMGLVKTRISRTNGIKLAFDIYAELLAVTARTVENINYHVAYTGRNPGVLKTVFINAESFFRQSGNDLGHRLRNAFLKLFKAGNDSVCAIGCDCPALTAGDISHSLTLLEKNDVVIGPAHDGGYYLISCRPNALAAFNASGWGTPDLLEETIRLCEENHFLYVLLEDKFDVDTIEDFNRWKNGLRVKKSCQHKV